MKKLTIELLNLVMEHCKQSESESAFQTLQDLDDFEFCESDDDYRDVFSHYTQVITWEDDCVLIQHF